MAMDNEMKSRWLGVVRVVFGCAIGIVTLLVTLRGAAPWYLTVFGLCVTSAIVVGKRRILRAGVTRTSADLVCRYVPWYETSAYFLNVVLPLLGIAMIAAGFDPGYPAWFRYGGILLLLATLLMAYATFRMWSRCSLRFTPSTLTIRVADPKIRPGELPRDRVEAITPKWIANSVSGAKSLQVEIAYRPADSTTAKTETVMLGLQLTVEPINLYGALVTWKDGSGADPGELLDRIEQLLRGHSAAIARS
ncbi:hypothetical protein MANY_10990 [Mycolicibacterium anyangense]|uniref:Uncharacterized protein n=1 Tax=Mycolicibacterium anyangense TaxID=1431246 RepID=A0A6N4W6V3_9MYCO|nr:hypothetical protein [Mycolicibacterium anyangense]BBZ75762.1 hypothetical protein MANY_10990 [Mycolicibacterium anyangense]